MNCFEIGYYTDICINKWELILLLGQGKTRLVTSIIIRRANDINNIMSLCKCAMMVFLEEKHDNVLITYKL